MSEHMDELAKSMASGVSRRSVFRRMLAGLFGAGAVALFPRRAGAEPSAVAICIQENCQGLQGLERAFCVVQCALGGRSNNTPF